ncbi:MAG: Mur ligase domain-containing protein, partial [Kingella denitrificans]
MYSQTAAPKNPQLPTLQHLAAVDERLCADSRQIRAGDTFVACRGEYADGRDYIQAAVDNGAGFVYWD